MQTSIPSLAVTLVLTLTIAAIALSKSTQESGLKNIKVLTDLSADDVQKEMQTFSKALGVRCSYCHEGSDFSSDENPKKETARTMIVMVRTINKDFLAGKASCNLCHRGAAIPDASKGE